MANPRVRAGMKSSGQSFGLNTHAQAFDAFTNMAARMGWGTPSLTEATEYNLVRLSYDYWLLITLFRNHWISRRIVEAPAQDMVRAWPKLTSEIDPKDLTRIDRCIRRTKVRARVLECLKWARLFGGSGALMIIDGQENQLDEPLDLETVNPGSFKGLIPFDRWSGITPEGEISCDINRPDDFNLPETYRVSVQGGTSFIVHSSRLLRFMGPDVPSPEYQAQQYWGISVLEPAYEEIRKRDNMSWNILSLTFRACILGMKIDSLAQTMSGLGMNAQAGQHFEARMSAINHLISNQSIVPLPKEGGIESVQYSFGGLSDVYQQFQLDISGAAQIPVTRLWGRTLSGLGQSNDADERIYEEKIAADQEQGLRPQLEKLYRVVCMSELGEEPDDLDLIFPSVRVLDEKEKAELTKAAYDAIAVAINTGFMSPRVGAKEAKQISDLTGIGTNLTDDFIETLPDTVQAMGEMDLSLPGFGTEKEQTAGAAEETE